MKYFFKLLIFLTALTSFAQNPGGLINAPLTTELDSLVVLKANKRSAHVPYTNFEAKLKARFDNYYAALGSGFTPTLQQVTTEGATTSNNITIANNDYPRFIIQNTSTNNYATYWDNSIVFSYPGGHAINLLKPASFTGNYTLSIPAITANDTIALKSELVGLGGVSLSGNNTWTGLNTFKNKLLLESLINGYLGGFKITNDGIMEIGDTELQDLSVRITSFSGLSQINLGDGQINVVGDFNVGGSMVASSFVGDGSGLTNLPSGSSFDPSAPQTITGAWTFTGGTIEVPTPTTSTQAVPKAFTDALSIRLGDVEASQYVQNDDINTLQLDVAALETINKTPLSITYSASMSDTYTRLQPNRVVTMAGNGSLAITGTYAAGDTGMLEVKGSGDISLINDATTPKVVSAPTLVWFIVNNDGDLVWYTDEGGETINIVSQTGDGNTTINWETSVWQKFNFGAQNDVLIFSAPSTPKDLLTLEIKQDGVGSRTLIWGNDILAAGGVMPTLSLGANDTDVVHFSYDGTNYKLLEDYLDFQLVATSFDGVAPTAPTSLAASSITDTTLTLDWTASTDNVAVTGYKVYKDAVLLATLGNVLTYNVTLLVDNTTYSFTVTALDAAGNESAVSNTETITTDKFFPDLIAQWDLSANGNDSSGEGNNLTLFGSPSFVTEDSRAAIQFNGTSQYATTSGDIMNGLTEFTITGWAKIDATAYNEDRPIYTTNTGTYGAPTDDTPAAIALRYDDFGIVTSRPKVMKGQVMGAPAFESSANVYNPNGWYHWALVFDEGVGIRFYKNGIEVTIDTPITKPTTMIVSGQDIFTLGRGRGTLSYFKGFLSDFKVYSSAKDAAFILAEKNATQ